MKTIPVPLLERFGLVYGTEAKKRLKRLAKKSSPQASLDDLTNKAIYETCLEPTPKVGRFNSK